MPTVIDNAIDEATQEILEIDKKISGDKAKAKAAPSAVETTEEDKGSDAESEESESEESEESTGSEEESSDEDFDEATLSEAKNLYKAIKSEQGPAIIAALAQQVGLFKAETKQEVKSDARTLATIVEEALGPEFKMLVPQMTKMMEGVLEAERQERTARFNEIEQQNTTREVVSVMDKVAKENKISTQQLERLISPLTEDFKPGPKTSAESYIRGLYKQATIGRAAAKTTAQIADKARRNATDAPSRLNSAGSGAEKSQNLNKKRSLKESIAWAQQEIANRNK